jgi:DNA-directed RNA polymerase subunit RPC12/RpoP
LKHYFDLFAKEMAKYKCFICKKVFTRAKRQRFLFVEENQTRRLSRYGKLYQEKFKLPLNKDLQNSEPEIICQQCQWKLENSPKKEEIYQNPRPKRTKEQPKKMEIYDSFPIKKKKEANTHQSTMKREL